MPYKPGSIDANDRSFAYNMLWLGLPFSLAFLVGSIVAPTAFLTEMFACWTGGLFVGFGFLHLHDEVMQLEVAFAARFPLIAAGLWMLALPLDLGPVAAIPVTTGLAAIASIFFLALAYRRLRDRA